MDEQLKQYLQQGERLLWSGRPKTGLMLTRSDWLIIPFSLFWSGIAIPIQAISWFNPGTPLMFKLFGVPFILVGLFLLVGRFVVDAFVRARTTYGVTDRRVLIVVAGPFSRVTSIALDQLPQINFRESRDGQGSLQFGPSGWAAGGQLGALMPSLSPVPSFLGIPKARQVFDLIQRAAQDS